MNLLASIELKHSKANTLYITNWIGDDATRFAALMNLFMHGEEMVQQRAAWIVNHCFQAHSELLQPWLKPMLKNLKRPGLHDAVKRNSLKIFSDMELSKKLQGSAANICFDILANPKEAVAIQVHAMTVLYNICKTEKDFAPELRLLIEDGMKHGTAGYRSRGRKILKALDNL